MKTGKEGRVTRMQPVDVTVLHMCCDLKGICPFVLQC